jgi:hypothetical protein
MADSVSLFDSFPEVCAPLSVQTRYLNAAKRMIYEELTRGSSTTEDSSEPLLMWGCSMAVGTKRARMDEVEDAMPMGTPAPSSSLHCGGDLHPEYLRSLRIHREVFEEAAPIVVPERWNGEWERWRRSRRERIGLLRALEDKTAALTALQQGNAHAQQGSTVRDHK